MPFRSLGDLNREDSDEERDDTNDYYAGGEKSGMVVQGGDQSNNNNNNNKSNATNRAVVDDLFQSARRLGARSGHPDDLRHGSGPHPSSSSHAFTGSSYTLSGGGGSSSAAAAAAADGDGDGGGDGVPDMHTITFYRNGIFTVDDGEPRDVQDPSNKDFIDSIGRGEVPREFDTLRKENAGGLARPPMQPVHVNLVSRMEEDYVPPAKPKYVAFAGQGNKLSDSSCTPAVEPTTAPGGGGSSAEGTAFEVDETQPVTSIQLRLMDGTRMVARFNPGIHTISDIRAFINRARPSFGTPSASYQLVTSFPTTVLTDESKTIEEAGLANAVILQKAC